MISFLKENPNFRNFWFGQLISLLGDRIHILAVIWLVYSWTNSGATVGLVLIASTLPTVLLSPIAGNLLDRLDRRKIMITCDFIRSAFVLALSMLAYLNMLDITIIIIFTIVLSLGAGFFNPATMTVMPSIVDKNELTQANAFYQLSANASAVFGFLLGSGLIALIGVPIAFAINGCSFLFSAYFLFRVHYPQIKIAQKSSFRKDFSEVLKISKSIPLITKLFTPVIIVNFFFSALFILIPVFAEGVFRRGSSGLGLLLTGLAFGMFVGALILSGKGLKIKVYYAIIINLIIIGFSFFAMTLFSDFYFYIFVLFIIGVALNLSNILLLALFQRIVPNEIRGKVFGLLVSASISSQPISYGLMGLFSDIVKPAEILLACGIAIVLTAFLMVRVKEIKEYDYSK